MLPNPTSSVLVETPQSGMFRGGLQNADLWRLSRESGKA